MEKQQTTLSVWHTVAEGAAYLRLPSVKAMRRMIERREIRVYRLGRRRLRLHRDDLDAALRPEESQP